MAELETIIAQYGRGNEKVASASQIRGERKRGESNGVAETARNAKLSLGVRKRSIKRCGKQRRRRGSIVPSEAQARTASVP